MPEKREEDASDVTPITPEEEIELIDEVSIESTVRPCLREIDISDSQLKLVDPYTMYPVPDDPGLLPAFWMLHEPPPIYAPDGIEMFHDAVKRWGLRSIGSLKDMLTTDEVNLRYYGVESRVMRAICEALANNIFVQRIDLKVYHLQLHINIQLIKKNFCCTLIYYLIISEIIGIN